MKSYLDIALFDVFHFCDHLFDYFISFSYTFSSFTIKLILKILCQNRNFSLLPHFILMSFLPRQS